MDSFHHKTDSDIFNDWLIEMARGCNDLVLEMVLILEFAVDYSGTWIQFFEWSEVFRIDEYPDNHFDVMYKILCEEGQSQKVSAEDWIPKSEMNEFIEFLRNHENQNWKYTDIEIR